MKFTLLKSIRQDILMRPILLGLLLFTLAYLIADIFVKYSSFGIFSSQIHQTLFGNEDEFLDPINKAAFLEFWHMEIFFIMMILLSLSAVFIRLCASSTPNLWLLNILLITALTALVSLVLAFFISSYFIDIYVFSFFTWHLIALYMALFSLWNLFYDPSL